MINDKEKKKYIFKEKRDYEILELVHKLEKLKLSDYEKFLLLWARTQLEDDWRKPLLQILKVMKKNSGKSSKERLKRMRKFADRNFWKP